MKSGTLSGMAYRLRVAAGLAAGLRRHDWRAARTFVALHYPGQSLPVRWGRFVGWSLRQMFSVIPQEMREVTIAKSVDCKPIWLAQGNPLANHPWQGNPAATLTGRADTVVIGAGFTGGAMAYHWSKKAPDDRIMVVLEMDDPADGSSGRNEGLVVMGRYYAMVYQTVGKHLSAIRKDLDTQDREQLARQFARVYCQAAYRNGDLIEQTVRSEGFDCHYVREGWVQAAEEDQQITLAQSVRMAQESGCDDWTAIDPDAVYRKTGMRVRHNSGFSLAAASFHPAKWVWSLLQTAMANDKVQLFTRTRVLRVEEHGDGYRVHTTRGVIHCRYVVSATESYTPLLHRQFHNKIQPTQTQAAFGDGGPDAMQAGIGISGALFFAGKHQNGGVLIGSDATRVPDRYAGRIQPSRFLTKFALSELKRHYPQPYTYRLTHEWSGTVGFTPDEYPVVGLIDTRGQYLIAGMAGSGSAVSFNGARCLCNRILGRTDEPDDYPAAYFAPSRLLDPEHHQWPEIEKR